MVHIIESVYAALVTAAVLTLLLPARREGTRYRDGRTVARVFLVIGMVFLIADLDTWRSIPASVALFGYGFIMLFRKRLVADRPVPAGPAPETESRARRTARLSVGVAGLALCATAAALIYVFPTRDLDRPAGGRTVGTASFMMQDDARTGVYGDAPGQARRIMVQAWYPVAGGKPAGADRAIWLPDPTVRAEMAGYAGIPSFALSHLSRVRTNAWFDATPDGAAGRLPVVILSHGWSGTRFLHADLAEELASGGALVLAIDHSYGALAVTLPDGTVLPWVPLILPRRADSEAAFLSAARGLVENYARDVELVSKAVRSGTLPGPLAALADPGRIGLAGHSTGGGADVLVAIRDPGIKAVLGLDAWVEPLGAELDAGTEVPQLHLGSESWDNDANEPWLRRLESASGSWAMFRVSGTGHEDFAMTLQVTPIARFMGLSRGITRGRFRLASTRTGADWLLAVLSGDPAAAYAGLPEAGAIPELSAD